MIFADPPYFLSNDGTTCHAGRRVSVNKGEWDRSRGFTEDVSFHRSWITQARRILKPTGTIWISGTLHNIYQCGFLLQEQGFHLLNDICWYKPNAAPNLSCTTFAHAHETLIWAKKDKRYKHYFAYDLMKNLNFSEDKLKVPGKQMRSVWSIPTPLPEEKKYGKHPAQKPVALLKRILLASTQDGDCILDPFMGAGTTAVAAALIGRRYFIGIEKDAQYLEIAQRRLHEILSQARLL
ncbi:MAG: site-specific DNA-methyltransferase [Bacteroidia bacterium]|nr:site-specific DNA-methyltransferase [Bacteroidia bacterium]